jgi:hypothetical protein
MGEASATVGERIGAAVRQAGAAAGKRDEDADGRSGC